MQRRGSGKIDQAVLVTQPVELIVVLNALETGRIRHLVLVNENLA